MSRAAAPPLTLPPARYSARRPLPAAMQATPAVGVGAVDRIHVATGLASAPAGKGQGDKSSERYRTEPRLLKPSRR